MNKNNEFPELEEMRESFDMLKAHLDENCRLKEEQIKRAVRSDVKWRMRMMWLSVVLFVVAGLCMVKAEVSADDHPGNLPYFLLLMCVGGVGFSLYQGWKMTRLDRNVERNMIEVQKELLKYRKKAAMTWWKALLLYVGAFVGTHIALSLADSKSWDEIMFPTLEQIISYSVAGLIGFPVMYYIQKFHKKKYDGMVKQIEELEEMKKSEV